MARRRISCGAIALLACVGTPVALGQTWVGGVGVWSDPMNWTPMVVPNGAADTAIVDASGVASVVTQDINGLNLLSLTITAGDTVVVNNGINTTIQGAGGLLNDGTFMMSSLMASGSITRLTFSTVDSEIMGSGEIVMNDDPNNIVSPSNGETFTNGVDHTIRGAGELIDNTGGMVNNGTIIQEGMTTLLIDPNVLGFVNNGTMRATGDGGITFNPGGFTLTGTTVEVLDGSVLQVNGSADVFGGSIDTDGTGMLLPLSGSDFSSVTLTAGSQALQTNGIIINLIDSFTNDGTWNMDSLDPSGAITRLSLTGTSTTLDGTGEIVMNDDPQNTISPGNGLILTNGADHTIRGAGELIDNFGGMVNEGSIIQQGTNSMRIDPAVAGFENNGVMRAEGSGGFDFAPGIFDLTGTTVQILDGSRLEIFGSASVIGGTLDADGTGRVFPDSGAFLEGVTIDTGTVCEMANGATVTISDSITNNGTWNLNGDSVSGAITRLSFVGTTTDINGTGEIVFNDDVQNTISPGNGLILRNTSNHTIRGAGELIDNFGGMINDGAIVQQGLNPMRIDPTGLHFVNNGVMRAEGIGGFDFAPGRFILTGTTLDLFPTSVLDVFGSAVVEGGTIDGDLGSIVEAFSGSEFDGVTFGPTTTVNQANGQTVSIRNSFVNNGTWVLNSIQPSGSITRMSVLTDGLVLEGTGEILMSNDPQNIISPANGAIFTNGFGHTIRGAGELIDNFGGMVNEGIILATGDNGIRIDPTPLGFVNSPIGTMGGDQFFFFPDNVFDNGGIIAPGTSVGTLTIDSNSMTNSSTSTLLIELDGPMQVNADQLVVEGDYTAGGQLSVVFVAPFEPSGDGPYTIVSTAGFGSTTGFFANANPGGGTTAFNAVGGDALFDVTYNANTIVISNVRPAPDPCNPADLNFATAPSPAFPNFGVPDGALTPTDFSAFSFFFSTGDLRADINTATAPSPAFPGFGVPDGILTPTDFSAFAAYFGAGCPCTLPGCP